MHGRREAREGRVKGEVEGSSGGSRICKRGGRRTMASARSLNGVLEPTPGSRGRAPLKLKAFCPVSYKKWPKIKDLNENLSHGLRHTALRSHDHP